MSLDEDVQVHRRAGRGRPAGRTVGPSIWRTPSGP